MIYSDRAVKVSPNFISERIRPGRLRCGWSQMWAKKTGSRRRWSNSTIMQHWFGTHLIYLMGQRMTPPMQSPVGIRPKFGKPYKYFSHGLFPCHKNNRGGFYLSRFLSEALLWARTRHNEPALLVYLVDLRVFADAPVSMYDFFVNGTEARWQSTIQYYSCCQIPMELQIREAEGAAASAESQFDVDSFHCLVEIRRATGLRRRLEWLAEACAIHRMCSRQRFRYTERVLRQKRAILCQGSNQLRPPNRQRLDLCLLLVVYL